MTPSRTFALWGAFLAIIMLTGALVWGFPDPETPALLGGGAVLMWVLAAFVLARRLDTPRLGGAASTPTLSPPTMWLGASLTLLAIAAELGFWLALIAGGMAGVGLAGLTREWSAQRRAQKRAEERA